MSDRRVTLQTVADHVGVSRMTVSNAFSRPDQLSAELRERILAAAEDLGYAGPDPAARALAKGTTGAVGILLTDSLEYAFTDEVAALFLGAIAQELGASGLSLTLLSSSVTTPDVLPARDVPLDAALVYSCEDDSPAIDWLRRRHLPLVYVDQTPVSGITSVNIDDRAGARAAAQHVVDLGHRRIGIVTSNFGVPAGLIDRPADRATGHVGRQRMLGWLEALDAAAIDPVVVSEQLSGEATGRHAAELLLDLPEPPTAVLCFSDAMAYGVVETAIERGLSVPDDLSVVGYDDSPLAARMRPSLTTVRQDVIAKGRAAATELRTAMDRARTGSAGRAKRIRLAADLLVRDSTGPLRHRAAVDGPARTR
ncbi:MAG: LacI family DNA-binding transcriptional regulator [Acidimicrobiales bacterium]|nr:LacI family DNA-binding transcriptional regulator [Acidimicrobiales bacterium]MCB9394015.1 LacI family DNA-binding transcriptional regulator [Acidimicrobiaceae bacterium]